MSLFLMPLTCELNAISSKTYCKGCGYFILRPDYQTVGILFAWLRIRLSIFYSSIFCPPTGKSLIPRRREHHQMVPYGGINLISFCFIEPQFFPYGPDFLSPGGGNTIRLSPRGYQFDLFLYYIDGCIFLGKRFFDLNSLRFLPFLTPWVGGDRWRLKGDG